MKIKTLESYLKEHGFYGRKEEDYLERNPNGKPILEGIFEWTEKYNIDTFSAMPVAYVLGSFYAYTFVVTYLDEEKEMYTEVFNVMNSFED